MNKNVKDRLAVLEALEAAAEAKQASESVVIDETTADALDDEELITEAHWGLLNFSLTFAGGSLGSFSHWRPADSPHERFWRRVAERAATLLKEREIVLFPLAREDALVALEWIDAGLLTCRSVRLGESHSHRSTIYLPRDRPQNEFLQVYSELVHAFDELMFQTGAPLIDTVAELRADLVVALGAMEG